MMLRFVWQCIMFNIVFYALPLLAATNGDVTCSKNLTHLSGSSTIHSPNYPRPYGSHSGLSWAITATPGQLVRLQIIDFSIEADFDYVKVHEGNQTSVIHSTFTGDIEPAYINLTSNVCILVFFSDHSNEKRGFQIKFSSYSIEEIGAIDTGNNVRQYFMNMSGIIRSPNYPSPYENNLRIRWYLEAAPLMEVQLEIVRFQLQHHWDYLGVSDGNHTEQKQIRLTGYIPAAIVHTNHHLVVLEFVSDCNVISQGFTVLFSSIRPYTNDQEIDEMDMTIFENGSATIETPNYPEPYEDLERITWILTADRDKLVKLHIVSFSLEFKSDYLDLFEGNQTIVRHSRYTGRVDPVYVHLRTNIAILIFVSDDSGAEPGFQILFSSYSLHELNLTSSNGLSLDKSLSDGSETIGTKQQLNAKELQDAGEHGAIQHVASVPWYSLFLAFLGCIILTGLLSLYYFKRLSTLKRHGIPTAIGVQYFSKMTTSSTTTLAAATME